MQIYSIGYNHTHGKNFVIDRPKGLNSWLFLLLKTPAIFMENNKEVVAAKNSFILYSENIPQYYRAYGEEYANDWFHFTIPKRKSEFLTRLNIPLNRVTKLGDINQVSSLIRVMTYEFYSQGVYKKEILDYYLNILFLKISETLNFNINYSDTIKSIHFEKLLDLRKSIYNTPKEYRSVDKMAEAMSMSRSSFQHTYKKVFGVSVSQDIITGRLNQVKFFLSTTDMPLRLIAEHCGYNSEVYLMRQFKERFGVTPSQYRKFG